MWLGALMGEICVTSGEKYPSKHLHVQSQQYKHSKKWTYFTLFSNVSIVNFE